MRKVRSKLHPTEIGVIKTFSLSPNDEIGEIAVECSGCTYYYNNLAELCEKWEDYEEPKGKALIWMILTLENLVKNEADDKWVDLEDCNQMLEKLKAWERLKDKGFINEQVFSMNLNWCNPDDDDWKAFKLLFGGKE